MPALESELELGRKATRGTAIVQLSLTKSVSRSLLPRELPKAIPPRGRSLLSRCKYMFYKEKVVDALGLEPRTR